jgi:N-sulfoglucosamine sulfohydrolase
MRDVDGWRLRTGRHACWVAAVVCLTMACAGTAAERPNILFAIADDWSWPHAGAYGDAVVHTPTFDRLTHEGVLFQHAYVSAPSCTASRGAILTGQWHWRLRAGANLWSVFPDEFATYPELLARAGYETGVTGKGWGPGRPATAGRRLAGTPYPNFEQFMRQRDRSKPFCFWLGGTDPHRPYELGAGQSAGIDVDSIKPFPCLPNVPEVRSDVADYYFEVQRFDQLVGVAIQALEDVGELDRTLIIMTSDNGMPFPRCKANLYDSGTRMPLVIRWGSCVKPGRAVSDFVSFTDFAPTILEAAGLVPPADMTGRSCLNLLLSDQSGQVDPGRDCVLTGKERHCPAQEQPDMGGYPCRALRTHEYLYIRNFAPDRWPAGTPDYCRAAFPGAWLGDCDNGPTKTFMVEHRSRSEGDSRLYDLAFGKRPAQELYDLRVDPHQLRNVAAKPEYASTLAQLAKWLEGMLRASGDPRVLGNGEVFDTYEYFGGAPLHPEYEAAHAGK